MNLIPLSEDPSIKKIYSAFFEQELPADLLLVAVWLTASIVAIYLPLMNSTPIRIILTLPTVLFIPGYCLIAALFPKEGDIDLMERIALSFGLSVAVVPMIGFGLNFTPWGIRLDPIVISLTVFSMIMILVAHYRRSLLLSEDRFRVPFTGIAGNVRKAMFSSGGSRIDRVLSIALALAILIAIITTFYVISVPKEGERFTEFYILGQNGTASDYPRFLTRGYMEQVIIGIGNHEYQNTTYIVEIWWTNMTFNATTNTTLVNQMEKQGQFSVSLMHNETYQAPHQFIPTTTGFNQLTFLMFKETAPPDSFTGYERINSSYRDLHLWIQ